ncbi:hypothetical protein NQ318_000894 [Aromia moschata]|uniref:PBZ-type domain-containing protein n=1 Tax=Aromia moschata TaxID=1265417 RepID=A0AAV8ZGW2_9CUCU|nr:hypothetical protein NQ318_000894 [Aromia moschata]
MTLLKIYNLEDSGDVDVVCTLPEGEHVIGRGTTLNCQDKRVSRQHAVISVGKDFVKIKAVHVNPCFFKAANSNSITVLPKDTSAVLNDDDQFALLADVFWFRVKVERENTVNGATERDDLEGTSSNKITSNATNNGNIPNTDVSNSNVFQNSPSTSKRCSDEESDVKAKRSKMIPDSEDHCDVNQSLGTDNNQSERGNIAEPIIDAKKLINNLKNIIEQDYGSGKEYIKRENEGNEETPPPNRDINPASSSNAEVKQGDPDGSVQIKKEKTDDAEKKVVKEKKVTLVCQVVTLLKKRKLKNVSRKKKKTAILLKISRAALLVVLTMGIRRSLDENIVGMPSRVTVPRCPFRKNPIHRQQFSHPGDDDYDSDPNDDRPNCPFGAACYRRNLQHRRQFKHPNPPASRPNDGDGNTKKKKRKPKRPKTNDSSQDDVNDVDDDGDGTGNRKKRAATKDVKYRDETPEDDYDYEDPFMDDASSDAFELSSDSASDSDWDDSQEVDEESQETRRLLKEAKKFTKGQKN